MIDSTINSAMAASMQGQIDSTDDIRRLATHDERAALEQATRQFEALFVQMMMKTMRSTVGESGLFSSSVTQTFRDMQDAEISKQISASGGLGLTEAVIDSVMQQAGVDPEQEEKRVDDTLSHLRNRTSGPQ